MMIQAIIGAFVAAIGGNDVFFSILSIPFLYAIGGVFYKIAL